MNSGTSSKIWSPPPVNTRKINFDASLVVDGWVGLRVIARDSNRDVIFRCYSSFACLLDS